ncbi:inosine triphosphate pyrophosphatase-like [Stylonychia lemnae]|uniref:Inosine triphosphate pyrophosphatase-like n=1 Tax=Stylonychia lemnae TaxID=5949 RepID=A0A078B019_STYLE|nr:inosine triphosphate pyrophosphatase-like [Stylonychia lemnae]|eukprot:CDW88015.1 inosine triphosphate pyrophosphatase-like [Stylonychia lemnae]
MEAVRKRIPLTFITGNKKKLEEFMSIMSEDLASKFIVNTKEIDCKILLDFLIYIKWMNYKESQNLQLQEKQNQQVTRYRTQSLLMMCLYVSTHLRDFQVHICKYSMRELIPISKSFLDKIGRQGLVNMVQGFEDRTAYAQCIYAFCESPEHEPQLFVGKCPGQIVAPAGENMFGWDPIFLPDGFTETFAQMDMEEKNKISHRGRAGELIKEYLTSNSQRLLEKFVLIVQNKSIIVIVLMEIKTFLRVRPVSMANQELYEISEDSKSIVIKESVLASQGMGRKKQVQMDGPPADSEFKFEQIFNMDSSQNEIYKATVFPLLDQAMNKQSNTAIIAHGENQTGKSYTIFGVENIQQEEFSIDQEDPKDTRGVVMKAIHYIFKKAKVEGKSVSLECQMLDVYLDTIRDLSKGKTNKFNKQSVASQSNLMFEREKDVEIEELANGDIKLNNIQNLDYQKKLENDNGQFRSFAHTIFIINLTYGKEIISQIYFVDLGSSERKGSKKQKEGFVVQGSLASFQKLICQLQVKLSDEEREMLQFKDNKLSFVLKNLYKEYTRINFIFHVSITESGLETALKTLETSDRMKSNQIDRKNGGSGPDNGNGNLNEGEQQEFSIDQLIQHLNKENFDLRNQIETLKRSHKIKLEELQQILQLPVEIEYLLKNKETAPEMQMIHEQRKAMEKADSLIKANKDLEKRLDFLQTELQELKKDKKLQQEQFSQKFIVLNSQIEQLREDKESHKMQLENQLRMNKAYSAYDLKQVQQTGQMLVSQNLKIAKQLEKNDLFKSEQDQNKINVEMEDIKDKVKGDSVLKYQRLYSLQIKAQEKEIQRIQEQYESQIKMKEDQLQKLIALYHKQKAKRESEIKEANEELKKLYEVFIKQDQIVQGLKRGDYSGASNTLHIPQKDMVPHPERENFIQLTKIQDSHDDKSSRTFGKKFSQSKLLNDIKHQKIQSMHMTNQSDHMTSINAYSSNQNTGAYNTPSNANQNIDIMKSNIQDLEYDQMKQLASKLQQEIKKIKAKPLNPDNIRIEKIKELQEERERLKDLYMAESIKNRESQNQATDVMSTSGDNRPSHTASASQRPMTTVSQGSTIRGGFFVTQMGNSRPNSRFNQGAPRRNIIIKQ